MLPRELQGLLDQIDACEADAERLVADLDEEAVNWTPAAGGWSVAQCLSHLTLMNDFYLREWPEALAAAAHADRGSFRGLHPTPFGRWFVRYLEPPYRMKSKAAPTATPPARVPRDTLLRDFKQSHETYRHLVRGSAAVDVNRVVHANALIKQVKMRLSTVLMIIPAHDRRHLWQAANVRALRRV
jgi:hypothetical protein